jgi:hypothetical protein
LRWLLYLDESGAIAGGAFRFGSRLWFIPFHRYLPKGDATTGRASAAFIFKKEDFLQCMGAKRHLVKAGLGFFALGQSVRPHIKFSPAPFNLRHVVVLNALLAAIVPLDGHASPIRFGDGALVGLIFLPANAVTDF